MRKNFTVITILALFSISTLSAKEFDFGVKAGMNVSTISNSGDNYGAAVGVTAGATAGYVSDSFWGISVELLYSEQGCRYNNKDIDFVADYKDLYFNVPILFNYYVINGLSFNVGVQAGAFLQRRLKMTVQGEDFGTRWFCYRDINKKVFDLAIPVGVAYAFDFGVYVDARYNIGVMETMDINLTDEKRRNNSFALTVGYKF